MPFDLRNNDGSERERTDLLDALCASGLVAQSDKRNLEDILSKSGAPIDQALSRLGLVAEDALADFYAKHFNLPRWTGNISSPFEDPTRRLNKRFLERHRIIPVARDGRAMIAMVVDPTDRTGLEGLAFALGGAVFAQIATASEFERLFASLFSEAQPPAGASDSETVGDDAAKLKDLASAEPAVRLVNRLIVDAANARASDIHMEPKERSVDVRRRIDGVLATIETLSKARGVTAVSRLKILAGLDIAERRRPQDGRLSFPVAGRPVDMRVSTTPTIHGESVVIRLLEKPGAALSLDALGFEPSKACALKRMVSEPNGMLLITGPTGSGKTTTLYALLEMLAKRELKILTIEDPVEYRVGGVSQTQVNPAIGLDFANAMRSFLRHDPDVIMVGEMRDLETARTAVQAALTGHLVLSTLHTNDAPSAITRLLDMGVEDYLLNATLLGVVAQRLVRRLCSACRGHQPEQASCAACQGVGYAGRMAVSEVLELTDAVKTDLRKGVTAAQLRRMATKTGFEPMLADGEAKVRAALTDECELIRVLGHDRNAS
jgi:general secretion pathway protein E